MNIQNIVAYNFFRKYHRVTFLLFLFMATGCTKHLVMPSSFEGEKPKNIVLIIGDGMGISHLTSHIYGNGESIFQEFKDVGLVLTNSGNNYVTDSGAGATAMATGVKTINNSVGVNMEKQRVKSVMEYANEAGLTTGIVTTSSLMDATPAGFYAHQENRYFTDSIARELLRSDIDFLVGGGKQYFDDTMEGHEVLLGKLEEKGYYVTDLWKESVSSLDIKKNSKIIYFNGMDGPYLHATGFDHLAKSSKKAFEFMDIHNPNGYFLVIEGAQIDWASHAGRSKEVLLRMQSMEETVSEAIKYAAKDNNTLVIITADHATGGLAILDSGEPDNLKLHFSTNGHTGEMVPIFAYGPGAKRFRGVMQNTDIFFKIMELLELGHDEKGTPPITKN